MVRNYARYNDWISNAVQSRVNHSIRFFLTITDTSNKISNIGMKERSKMTIMAKLVYKNHGKVADEVIPVMYNIDTMYNFIIT